MAERRTEEERPQPVGLNRRNIAIAAAVSLAVIGGTAFILVSPPGELVELEGRAPRVRAEPERQIVARRREPPERVAPLERDVFQPPARIERPRAQVERERPRRSLYEEALRSSLRFPKQGSQAIGSRAGGSRTGGSRSTGGLGGDLERMLEDLERQGARLAELGGAGSFPGGELFGSVGGSELRAEVKAPRFLEAPERPYLSRGTLIPGQLLTAINSDLPGQILGTVVRDVLDSGSLERVVIPKGSRLVGRYDSDLAVGQNRVFIAWNEIQFPDGGRLILPAQPGVDAAGTSGLADRVNHHTGRILGQAALLSLIGAGFELARPAESGVDRSARAVTGASNVLEAAAAELLRRQGAIRPTVKIRQGQPFQVFVTQQVEF